MPFRELREGLANSYPLGTSERFKLLDAYERVLNGTIYDHLQYPYSNETDGGTYIPMMQRRPAVIYALPSIVVGQCAALMFGDEQSPTIRCWSQEGDNPFEAVEKAIETIVDRCDLEACMLEAVETGAPGSVAIICRSVGDERELYWEVQAGKFCRPVYDSANPLRLIGLVQIYPTKAKDLFEAGYTRDEIVDPGQKPEDIRPEADYWVRIEFDRLWERRFIPMSASRYQQIGTHDAHGRLVQWVPDEKRSVSHEFGVVPVVYIRQFTSKGIDGICLFGKIVDICYEIDYQLSQRGRGLRYSADPLLAISRGELASQNITGPIGEDALRDSSGKVAKTAANILDLEAGAKAEVLEITGQGLQEMGEHIKQLREYALEVLGGMKSSSEHEKGVQSGKALDKLWEVLRLLVKRLRIPYGNRGLLPLIRLIMAGIARGAIVVPDVNPSDVDPKAPMRLIWPQMSVPQGAELLAEAEALVYLGGGTTREGYRVLDDDTVTRLAANRLGLTDPNAVVKAREAADAEDEKAAAEALEQQQQHAITLAAAKPKPAPPQRGNG